MMVRIFQSLLNASNLFRKFIAEVFQGCAPKTVTAKLYTGKELERLKRIYDKAGLKVLS